MRPPRLIPTTLYLTLACSALAQNPGIRVDEPHSTTVVTPGEIKLNLRVAKARAGQTTVNTTVDVLGVDDKVAAHAEKEMRLAPGEQMVQIPISRSSGFKFSHSPRML